MEENNIIQLYENNSTDSNQDELFKEAVEAQLKKVHTQGLLIGAQTMCKVILDKIVVAQEKPSKMTMNDYKRLVKDITSFCRTGISRKVKPDGETEPIEEDSGVKQNSTK